MRIVTPVHPKSPPLPVFKSVGRNSAATFAGFCANHDRELFRRIDNEVLDVRDHEQLFLLAYRAITRELHTTMAAASRAQRTYLKAVSLGLAPGERPSELGMFAVERMAVSWETFRYRSSFDEDLVSRRFDRVRHRIIEIPCSRPTVAVSSLFSVDSVISGSNCLLVSLSILPLEETRSVAVFSWWEDDDPAATKWLGEQCPGCLSGSMLAKTVSRLVLANCENIVFAPWLVEGWSTEKREQILNYYLATAFDVGEAERDIDVDLFQ
jgi:hypothetical protein